MAIKQLRLAKNLKDSRSELDNLISEIEALNARKEELEKSVKEAETNEDFDVLETEEREIQESETELLAKKAELEKQIEELEKQLDEIEEQLEEEVVEETKGERKTMSQLITRGAFQGMTRTDVDVVLQRENVQNFLGEVRTAMKEKRALTGGEYAIPTDLIAFVKEETYRNSKLLPLVTVHNFGGDGRITVAGQIPEAVWTEMCAALNELDLTFSQVELDGYKVGGYVAVCNAVLEDSDFDLANYVLGAIAEAIAKAVDKAILYGTDNKMPLGIVKALENAGSGLSAVAKGAKGEQWLDILAALNLKSHGASEKVFVMNETTYHTLLADMLNHKHLGGAAVSAKEGTMPLGGKVVLIDDVPADVVIGGYFKNYVALVRTDVKLARSEHAQFIEDNTVFKGTQRMDGAPVHADAFAAVKIGEAAPTSTEVTFAGQE